MRSQHLRLTGVRDRSILEALYSTGMRRMEVAGLRLYDLDPGRGTVMVRLGRGKRDRVVPIGDRALAWVRKYLADVRPGLVIEPDEGVLFLSQRGRRISDDRLSRLVRRYVDAADLGKGGACHLLRHTMATLMLEGGADIRFIQAMLGHASLKTTQVYAHVSIGKLKEVHAATHPAGSGVGRRERRGHRRQGATPTASPRPAGSACTTDDGDDPVGT